MINKEFLEGLLGRLKIFWTSMILVFLVVSLQYLGLHTPNVLPLVSTKIQAFLHPTIASTTPSIQTNTQVMEVKKGVNK